MVEKAQRGIQDSEIKERYKAQTMASSSRCPVARRTSVHPPLGQAVPDRGQSLLLHPPLPQQILPAQRNHEPMPVIVLL